MTVSSIVEILLYKLYTDDAKRNKSIILPKQMFFLTVCILYKMHIYVVCYILLKYKYKIN